MLTLIYALGLWYFSLPLPPSTPPDTCYAEDGDITLSQKSIEDWTLLRAKCSCFIALKGSDQSEFSIVVVKAYAEQKQPRLSAILSVEQSFPEHAGELPVLINGQTINAKATPMTATSTVEMNGSADWIAAIAEAKTLQIGDYQFTSAQSQTAMQELKSCYASLQGK
ncbi:MAG: hypothetical protein LBE54_13035 [Brucellaceae bacterium]|jgi:hypothetical protein|nr:hypothetical protein [Brucellaceae bacterium]